jgi:hypothetical protein
VAENPTPTRDLIFSGVVDTQADPLVVVNEFEGESGEGNHIYVIWNVETFLSKDFNPDGLEVGLTVTL